MKITIKLDERKAGLNDLGYPIVVYASYDYGEKTMRTGYRAKKAEWNPQIAQPEKKHPQYYDLLDFLALLRERISEVKIQSRRNSIFIEDLPSWLFRKNHTVFFDAAMDLWPAGYKGTNASAVKSFNEFYPKIKFDEITYKRVDTYIKDRIRNGNSAAGVDSYIRSLKALWNKLSKEDNPFKGHRIEIPRKINRVATADDLKKLWSADLPYRGEIESPGRLRDYWLLQFFLGGIDPEVLIRLRYDEHFINGRIIFNRDKGMSKEPCDNLVPYEAFVILSKYDCYPYFIPAFKSTNKKEFVNNYSTRFKKLSLKLGLTQGFTAKDARHTFIDRAKQLLIPENLTSQLVGHKVKTTTSLYGNRIATTLQDAAHFKIIDF